MKRRVVNYFVKNGNITKRKPKGCKDETKGTKIKYPNEPDVRIKHCKKIMSKPRKKSKKKGKKRGRKKSKKN